MQTKKGQLKSSTEAKKNKSKRIPADRQTYQIKTAQARERARQWAATRRMHSNPIAVAMEITAEVTQIIPDRTNVLQTLQDMIDQLLQELTDLNIDIATI